MLCLIPVLTIENFNSMGMIQPKTSLFNRVQLLGDDSHHDPIVTYEHISPICVINGRTLHAV